jgi:hypothetical protein
MKKIVKNKGKIEMNKSINFVMFFGIIEIILKIEELD